MTRVPPLPLQSLHCCFPRSRYTAIGTAADNRIRAPLKRRGSGQTRDQSRRICI